MAASMSENMSVEMGKPSAEETNDEQGKVDDTHRCEMCSEGDSKYRCPRCGVRTCCLACVKQHKVRSGCNGQRNKTEYIAMQQFHEGQLMSDYHFLEQLGRKSDSVSRDPLRRWRNTSTHVNAMVNQARRKNISVRILPYSFTRRKHNTTIFHYRSRELQWHIDWHFPDEDLVCTSSRVVGHMTLRDALDQLLKPGPDGDADKVATAHRLGRYGGRPLVFLMEEKQGPKARYHKLDEGCSIDDNLAGKEIVEYPTITVTFKDKKCNYSIISNGEESDASMDSESDSSSSSSSSSDEDSPDVTESQDTSNVSNEDIPGVRKTEDTSKCSDEDTHGVTKTEETSNCNDNTSPNKQCQGIHGDNPNNCDKCSSENSSA